MSFSCFPFIAHILFQLISERHLEKQLGLYQPCHLNVQYLKCFILTDKQEVIVFWKAIFGAFGEDIMLLCCYNRDVVLFSCTGPDVSQPTI